MSGSGTPSNVPHSSILVINMDIGDTQDMPTPLQIKRILVISSTYRSQINSNNLMCF